MLARIGYLRAVGRVGRIGVVRSVIGNFDPLTSPVSGVVDGVDLVVVSESIITLIDYLGYLGTVRVGRIAVVRKVIGNFDLIAPERVDGVDLKVTGGSIPARVDYPIATWTGL